MYLFSSNVAENVKFVGKEVRGLIPRQERGGFDLAETVYMVDEVAERLKVCRQTVLRWIQARKLGAIRAGKKYLITQADLLAFLRDSSEGSVFENER